MSDLVVARNCCMARMLPGEAENGVGMNRSRTTIQVSIPMFSMSRNILAMSEFTSGGRHIGFQDGRQMFYITWYIT